MEKKNPSLKSLSHPVRVQILFLLANDPEGKSFSDLSRELQIESSGKLAFHLEKLSDFVKKDESGRYVLTENGYKAIQALQLLGVTTENGDTGEELPLKKASVGPAEISSDFLSGDVNKEDTGIDEDAGKMKLGIKQLGLTGIGLVFVLGLVIPLILSAIVHALTKNPNSSVYIIVFIFTAFIGNIITGYLLESLILTRGNNEVLRNPGLVLFIPIGFEFLLEGMILSGAPSKSFLILMYTLFLYAGIILGAWINHSFSHTKKPFVFLPRFSGDRVLIIGFILLAVLSINWYTKTITYTRYLSEYASETYGVGISSSTLGIAGFVSFSLYLIALLPFVFKSRHVVGLSKKALIYVLLSSVVVGIIFSPATWILASGNLFPNVSSAEKAIILAYFVLSIIFYIFGSFLASRVYKAHYDLVA